MGTRHALDADMDGAVSKADVLERRLIDFAADILRLSSKLPKTPQGRHITQQIIRSGTAAAANYGEARGAESRADFVHKLRVAFKELNETTIWLELLVRTCPIVAENATSLIGENRELCRIIAVL